MSGGGGAASNAAAAEEGLDGATGALPPPQQLPRQLDGFGCNNSGGSSDDSGLKLQLCEDCALIYSHYSNQHHMPCQRQKSDDTDSFTPRVRSDKRSIIILLGTDYYSTTPSLMSKGEVKRYFLRSDKSYC